jgi:excisionase family DNA binding protein
MAIVLMTVEETGRALGISRATVWRRIRRGELPTVRRGGRRLIPASALKAHGRRGGQSSIPPLTDDHPIFRLVGAGHGGGRAPGARDKHAILDR